MPRYSGSISSCIVPAPKGMTTRSPLTEHACCWNDFCASGVRRLIFTSSVAVYGSPSGLCMRGYRAGRTAVDLRGRECIAEKVCRSFASEALQVAVLRPALVYGPFSELWSMPYLARFASGRWRHLGLRGEGKCTLTDIGDLVRFVQFLISRDLGPYAVFNANGPEVPTWNSYLERFNAALGYPPLLPPDERLGLKVVLQRPVRLAGQYLMANHRELLIAGANRSAWLRAIMKQTEENLRLAPSHGEMQHFSGEVIFSMEAAAKAGFRATDHGRSGHRADCGLGAEPGVGSELSSLAPGATGRAKVRAAVWFLSRDRLAQSGWALFGLVGPTLTELLLSCSLRAHSVSMISASSCCAWRWAPS